MILHVNSEIVITEARYFLLFQTGFRFHTYQWLKLIRKNFWTKNWLENKMITSNVSNFQNDCNLGKVSKILVGKNLGDPNSSGTIHIWKLCFDAFRFITSSYSLRLSQFGNVALVALLHYNTWLNTNTSLSINSRSIVGHQRQRCRVLGL